MFSNLEKALIEEREARTAAVNFYIDNGYMPTWAEENRQDHDAGLQRYSTPAKWNAYKAGTLPRKKAVEIAQKRNAKQLEKVYAKKLATLRGVSIAPDLEGLEIVVTWTKSRTWGYNPHAVVYSRGGVEVGRGTASGYGYDKTSAAIADALNQCTSLKKALYLAAENALANGDSFKRMNEATVTWRDVLGYGSGYSIIPYFEGGCGVSCFEAIFAACGLRFVQTVCNNHCHVYTVTRKEAA